MWRGTNGIERTECMDMGMIYRIVGVCSRKKIMIWMIFIRGLRVHWFWFAVYIPLFAQSDSFRVDVKRKLWRLLFIGGVFGKKVWENGSGAKLQTCIGCFLTKKLFAERSVECYKALLSCVSEDSRRKGFDMILEDEVSWCVLRFAGTCIYMVFNVS